MRKGKASRTAQFVAYNRALANLAPTVPGFSEPIAERFLRPSWIKKVERKRALIAQSPGKSPFPYWFRGMGVFNQFRSVILDDAIRKGLPADQLVILGAGLDSRAWRLPELRSAAVYEVDHPDTQVMKREKTNGLQPQSAAVKFVAVDFMRDDLAAKLIDAGFKSNLRTLWLWEGVTMYLPPEQVAQNLAFMATLSSPGSRLALTYMARKNGKVPKSWFLALLGEPARSAFEVDELAQIAARAGWKTISNTGIQDWKRHLTPNLDLTERAVGLQWNERIWIGER